MKPLWNRLMYEPALLFGLPTIVFTVALTFWPGTTWLAFMAALSAALGAWATRANVTPTRKVAPNDH